ncbi:MAG: right-handed parallel beta-helix repeat-containing protein, partial [bacterium]
MNRLAALCAIATIAQVLHVPAVPASTLRVPEDHKTIQPAIVAASPGDTVLVGPGRYRELIRLLPGVCLKSAAGPDTTFLVSPGLAEKLVDERLIECVEGDRTTLIEGFSLIAEDAPGCAIFVENASPTIRGNVIEGFGWGIHLRSSKARIEGNEIRNCRTFGILCFASSPEIFSNSIHGNAPQGIAISGKESRPLIGGSAKRANKLFANEKSIVNDSRNDIDATHNDWGWEITAEMEAEEWPADIETIVDGNDRAKSHRGKGTVDYRHWV